MIFTLEFGDYTFPNQTFEVQSLPHINRITEETIVRQQGSVVQTPYLKARAFKIKGTIYNSNKAASLAELDSLQAGLLADKAYFRDRSDREIEAYTKRIVPTQRIGTDQSVIDVVIDMVAPIPFFSATGASVETAFSLTGASTFNLSGGGNVFNEPKIYIYASGGAIVDDIEINNITNNNQQFKFRGTIAAGQTVVLDSKNLTVLNNGVDGISDSEGEFILLLAGTNQFSFVGATCTLTFERKNRYY